MLSDAQLCFSGLNLRGIFGSWSMEMGMDLCGLNKRRREYSQRDASNARKSYVHIRGVIRIQILGSLPCAHTMVV